MKIKIKKLDISNLTIQQEKDWNTILQKSDDATIFHTPEWVRIISKEIGENSNILIAYDNNKPVGIFPFYIGKTFKIFWAIKTSSFNTPYGGPVAITKLKHKDKIIKKLIRKHENLFGVVRSRIILPPYYKTDPFVKLNYKIIPRETAIVDYLGESEEVIWGKIGRNCRNMINKAKKNEIEIEESDPSFYDEFLRLSEDTYDRLNLNMRQKTVKKTFELFHSKNMAKLIFAKCNGKIIWASIILYFNKSLMWWGIGTDKEYWRFGPGNLVHWYVVKTASKSGYKYYDLLHYYDNKGNIKPSLKGYKMRLGAKPVPFYVVEKDFILYKILKIFKTLYHYAKRK